MPSEKPLTIECARCYSTAIVPILSFGRGPRGDDTVGCAACGYTWRAPEDVTAAVVEAEQAWVESQVATEDDAPLHLLRDGTTGTTLEALHEAQREVEALSAPPVTRADYLARLAAMTQAYEHANEGVILGVTIELDEKDAVTWDGQTFIACDPIHALIEDATDARVDPRDARIADLEREKAALEKQVAFLNLKLDETHLHRCSKCESTVTTETADRQALAAGLADALEALADMTGFVEAQFYAEKYGVPETMARLKLLLPSEDSVATVKEPAP